MLQRGGGSAERRSLDRWTERPKPNARANKTAAFRNPNGIVSVSPGLDRGGKGAVLPWEDARKSPPTRNGLDRLTPTRHQHVIQPRSGLRITRNRLPRVGPPPPFPAATQPWAQ
jgi:hypothetical protein